MLLDLLLIVLKEQIQIRNNAIISLT
jgi:hypothetical protein